MMLNLEKVRKGSTVDLAFDQDGVEVLVERYKGGKVRILEEATAYALVNEDLTLVKMHFVRQGAAVSSNVDMFFQ